MSKYEDWIVQLLDDFWSVFYPGVPRLGNATERKCRTIEKELNKRISSSSLYNYFNEKGGPPADGTKGIMGYYILQHWKEFEPAQFQNIDLKSSDLSRNDAADRYLILYQQHKAKRIARTPSTNLLPEIEETESYHAIALWDAPKIKWSFLAAILLVVSVIAYLVNCSPIGEAEISNFAKYDMDILISAKDRLSLISVLHVLTILLLLSVYYFIGDKKPWEAGDHKNVNAPLRQFSYGWGGIWWSWVVLYIWMSIKYAYEKDLLVQAAYGDYLFFSQWSWAVADVFSALSTMCFFYLFFVLDMKTVSNTTDKTATNSFQKSMLLVAWCTVFCLILSIIDHFYISDAWDSMGTSLYALLASISMLYFFGRLDSHLFAARRILLAPLLLYAVIQVNWNDFPDSKFAAKGLLILLLAFLLKIYLFFIINNWLKSGDFALYFRKIRDLRK